MLRKGPFKVLDLFSGIGGFSLGLEWTGGFETVAFCEIEKYPQEILKKHWPGVPIYEDITELTADRLVRDGIGRVDVITGGYPCQPFSVAGKQRGEKDDRHLWPQMFRLIKEVRPTWIICENVTGHIKLGLDQVLSDLEGEGYACRTFVLPACSVDAPHRRDRVWIVAHANNDSQPDGSKHEEQRFRELGFSKTDDANADSQRGRTHAGTVPRSKDEPEELQQKDGEALPGDSSKICGDLAHTKKDDANADSQRSHRTKKHQHRKIESIDGEVGQSGQVCEVLARSNDSSNGNSADVADPKSKQDWGVQQPKFRPNTGASGEIVQTMGDPEHNGSSSGSVEGRNGKAHERTQEGSQPTKQSERAGRSRNNEDVAYTEQLRSGQRSESPMFVGRANEAQQTRLGGSGSREVVADPEFKGRQGRLPGGQNQKRENLQGHARCGSATHRQPRKDWWAVEPSVGRVANGIPRRVARLKALGNAVVPQIPMMIGQAILEDSNSGERHGKEKRQELDPKGIKAQEQG